MTQHGYTYLISTVLLMTQGGCTPRAHSMTGTHPHAQWRMLRGRKHTRSVRRMTAFEGILRELSVNLERTFGVQSRYHGRQLCISDTATLARHPSQQEAQHLPCGRPPDLFGPTLHPKLSSAMRSISPTMVSAFDIEHA